ncbi:MAG TPA: hypothetical protein VGA92_07915 [Candidatus Nitrosotenuis sp.]
MKYFMILLTVILAFFVSVQAFASHDPNQPQLHSIIIPPDYPPLKQFKAGLSAEKIICRQGLELVTKYDGSPACVKPETKVKLIERGWTKSTEHVDDVGEFWGSIVGVVMLGPTCPVVENPLDPECADKPYETTLVVTTADQSRVIKEFSSDANGKFSVEVSPGEYAIRSAAAANVLPYCSSNDTIKLSANDYTEITVHCDTGIR